VNAADNKQRDHTMNEVRVDIDPETNTISIYNNGRGIPIEKHKKEDMYIPELVLGNLFTGSNFNDKIAKVTGGRNGYGAKLTNIFRYTFVLFVCMSTVAMVTSCIVC
jgi:DNA topoisomerase-2